MAFRACGHFWRADKTRHTDENRYPHDRLTIRNEMYFFVSYNSKKRPCSLTFLRVYSYNTSHESSFQKHIFSKFSFWGLLLRSSGVLMLFAFQAF